MTCWISADKALCSRPKRSAESASGQIIFSLQLHTFIKSALEITTGLHISEIVIHDQIPKMNKKGENGLQKRLVKHQSLSCMPLKNLTNDMCIGDSSEIHNRCVHIRLLL